MATRTAGSCDGGLNLKTLYVDSRAPSPVDTRSRNRSRLRLGISSAIARASSNISTSSADGSGSSGTGSGLLTAQLRDGHLNKVLNIRAVRACRPTNSVRSTAHNRPPRWRMHEGGGGFSHVRPSLQKFVESCACQGPLSRGDTVQSARRSRFSPAPVVARACQGCVLHQVAKPLFRGSLVQDRHLSNSIPLSSSRSAT